MAELKFTKGTDQAHLLKLKSHLIYATWTSGAAFGGQQARIEVGTAFVGDGAKIEIEGLSVKGKKLGKIKDIIKGNKYLGELDIPDDVEFGDEVYFKVKLPKNDLDGESDLIPTHPIVRASNMKWSPAEARTGETVTLSADLEGVRTGTEVSVIIYEHDQDGAHDRVAEIPTTVSDNKLKIDWEFEYFEDTDEIPSQVDMEKYGGNYNPPEYFFTVKIGDEELSRKQQSGLLKFKDYLEITAEDIFGDPLKDREYCIVLADGKEIKGTLNAEGYALVSNIPPGRYEITFPKKS